MNVCVCALYVDETFPYVANAVEESSDQRTHRTWHKNEKAQPKWIILHTQLEFGIVLALIRMEKRSAGWLSKTGLQCNATWTAHICDVAHCTRTYVHLHVYSNLPSPNSRTHVWWCGGFVCYGHCVWLLLSVLFTNAMNDQPKIRIPASIVYSVCCVFSIFYSLKPNLFYAFGK